MNRNIQILVSFSEAETDQKLSHVEKRHSLISRIMFNLPLIRYFSDPSEGHFSSIETHRR